MMKTAAKIVKSVFRGRSKTNPRFRKISWVQEKILKHQEDQTIKTVAFENFSVSYKRPYELLHTYKEIFEREIYRFTTSSSNPLIIDCGANIGLSVLYYKTIYPAANVIAFEPDANNFQLLQKNINQNKCQQVTLRQEAVWIANGNISFSANETEASRISEQESKTVLVASVRFNDFLNQFKEIDFLKMDIEGAEWEVIRDCATNLPKIKNLFLEYHGKVDETQKLNDLLKIVNEAGFSVYMKMAADQLSHPFVEKTLDLPYDVQLNLFCYKQ
jgi:FkbM family methyltransferase